MPKLADTNSDKNNILYKEDIVNSYYMQFVKNNDEFYSKASDGNIDINTPTPTKRQSTSERSAASFELKAEVRRKLNEHIEKYGTLEKGVNPVRDVDLPKKTADDRYVRRGTRTVIESARVTDEVAQKLTEEIAKQIPAKWNDKLNTWRYFAMLGNPRTHIRNMAGNMVFMTAIFAKNLISAFVD